MDNNLSIRRPRILLGITGSIAAVKGPRLALLLSQKIKAHVRVVLTRTVERSFWKGDGVTQGYDAEAWNDFWNVVHSCQDHLMDSDEEKDWRLSNGSICVHYAAEEWDNYENLSSPVLHIQLRAWADVLLIAPLSAHTLSKIANGLCGDLLSCIARAWDYGQGGSGGKPVILCPAMNTAMWDHVLTRRQLDTIKEFGKDSQSNGSSVDNDSTVKIVEPIVKKLACGDVGAGALAELDNIVDSVKKGLVKRFSCSNGNLRSKPMRSSKETNTEQALSARAAIKRALLKYSKQQFSDMQSAHQQCQKQRSSASILAAPISPTPNDVIALFLPYLGVGSDSLLVDLGCGDGRWLVTATKLTGCKCLGIDIDDERLELAKQSIEKERCTEQIQVRKQDVFDFLENDIECIRQIDVLVVYLFRDAMLKVGLLLQQLTNELKRDVKILCIGFGLTRPWKASQIEKCCGITIYLYDKAKLQCKG